MYSLSLIHTHTQVLYYCKRLKTTYLYKDMLSELNVACHKCNEALFEYVSGKTQQIQSIKWENILKLHAWKHYSVIL